MKTTVQNILEYKSVKGEVNTETIKGTFDKGILDHETVELVEFVYNL